MGPSAAAQCTSLQPVTSCPAYPSFYRQYRARSSTLVQEEVQKDLKGTVQGMLNHELPAEIVTQDYLSSQQ